MTIIKINLHKVNAERNMGAKAEGINVKNNVSLKDVQEMAFDKEGKKGLRFNFEFDCAYEPEIGKIEIAGNVFYVEEAKLIDEIKESWDKDKRIPTTIQEIIYNAALHKGNVQAIKTADDVGLPSPLPMPKVSAKKKA